MLKNKNCKKVCLIAVTCFAVENMVAQDSKLFENNFNTEGSAKLTQPVEKLLNLEHDGEKVLVIDIVDIEVDGEVYSKTVDFKGELIVISFDKSKSLEDQLNKLKNDNDDAEKRDFIIAEFSKLVQASGFEQNNDQLVSTENEVNNEEGVKDQVIAVENAIQDEVDVFVEKDQAENKAAEQHVSSPE